MDALPALSFTPAVGDHAFTAKQRSLLSLANELGRTRFAPRAAQWDEEASFPFANYEDLRAAVMSATAAGAVAACWACACPSRTAAWARTMPAT